MTLGTEPSGRKPSESGIVGDLDAISLPSQGLIQQRAEATEWFSRGWLPPHILLPSLINRSRGPWGSNSVSRCLASCSGL